jgi:hypothetical protein
MNNQNKNKALGVISSVEYGDYFWVQRFSPSRDAIEFITDTQRFNELKYVFVNGESLSITKNADSIHKIESKIV